jgi:hypothetical protein
MKKIVLVIALCASIPGLVHGQQRPVRCVGRCWMNWAARSLARV